MALQGRTNTSILSLETEETHAVTAAGTMRAFVMQGPGNVALVDKPIPSIGTADALVKTTAALVCTSDVHTVGGAIGERHGLTLGHEAVGRIKPLIVF